MIVFVEGDLPEFSPLRFDIGLDSLTALFCPIRIFFLFFRDLLSVMIISLPDRQIVFPRKYVTSSRMRPLLPLCFRPYSARYRERVKSERHQRLELP